MMVATDTHLVDLEAQFQGVVVDETIQEEAANRQNPIPRKECNDIENKAETRVSYRQNK